MHHISEILKPLQDQFPGLIKFSETKYYYRTWKVLQIETDGTWECVRIQPTKWFRSSSLESALQSIDRRENFLTEKKDFSL